MDTQGLPPVAKARVWNDHTQPHVEDFKGDKITIEPGKFVVMDFPDAVEFRGQYTPVIRDGLGTDLKPKKIRVEKIDGTESAFPEAPKHACMRCGEDQKSAKALDAHIKEKHVDDMLDDEAKKKLTGKK